MKKIKTRTLKNLILLLLTFVCAMLLSCSCENFGLILDGDGVIVVPNFRPSFDDESDWVESESDTEKETEKETNKCSHEWELENAYPEGLTCLETVGVEMRCTKYHCSTKKTVEARGACQPNADGICTYCGKRATDISNFTFSRRGDKYYEAYLSKDFDEKFLTFPDHYLDLPVKLIGSEGPNDSVEQVFIPACVSQIFDGAFRNFTNLTSVYIEDGNELKNIRGGAFYGCKKLKYIPLERCNNLATIMGGAFEDCESLESVTIPASVTNIRDSAFRRCVKLSDIKILNDKAKYGDYVFAECDALTDISFVELRDISAGMFYGCDGIKYARIPDTVASIGESAFAGSGLQEVVLPDTEIAIGNSAFASCKELEKINLPSAMTYIPLRLFEKCESLREITIPAGVACINNYAFNGCSSLGQVVLPESIMHIHEGAFQGCTSLASVEFPKTFKADALSIYGYAFADCSALEYIDLPTEIPVSLNNGAAVFMNSGLREIVLPESITVVNAQIFNGCTSLESVIFEGEVTALGAYAFKDCSSLKLVSEMKSLKSLGNGAFSGCSSLESITLSKNIDRIGKYTFSGCTSLKSFNIPGSIIELGECAFADCTWLTSLNLSNALEDIPEGCFKNCKSLSELSLPENITWIGAEAFMASGIEYIKINKGVERIGASAFENTEQLRWVYFEDIGDWHTTVDGKYQKIPEDLANERTAALCLQKYTDNWANYIYGKG